MFCPLCRAEYRQGFAECSDCHLSLVASQEEAERSSMRLWKGDSERVQDRILEALFTEGIPSHYKSPLEFEMSMKDALLSRSTAQKLTFEVWVLRRDIQKAREITSDFTSSA